MGRIYFQRGSAQGYKANIARTLSSPLSREKIANVLGILGRTPSLAPVVASIQTDRPVFVWGTKSRQHVEIETMKTGDLAVFIVEGNPLHFGTISIILADDAPLEIRQALSDELWGESVWEYVWFLTDVKAVGLKKPDLERLLGRTLADLFGPYGTFRGVDERDTAAGSLAAFVSGLAKGDCICARTASSSTRGGFGPGSGTIEDPPRSKKADHTVRATRDRQDLSGHSARRGDGGWRPS